MKRSGKEAVLEPHEKRKRQRELLQPYIQDCQKRGIRVTQAALKTAYFLNDLLVKEEVLKQISLLRKNFDIPEEGLELESMILKEILAHPFYLPTEGYSLIKEFRDRIRPI
ncbi:MAG: hypothetical protein IPL87_01150 [Candidatus Moraniibacteriota bacterium]|nr:MAG: hypothetical protein IPL87_01150 [Candidatus Moranbacteria bacterium]